MRSLIEYLLATMVIAFAILLAAHAAHGMWQVWFEHRRHMSPLYPVLCAVAALAIYQFGHSRFPHHIFD